MKQSMDNNNSNAMGMEPTVDARSHYTFWSCIFRPHVNAYTKYEYFCLLLVLRVLLAELESNFTASHAWKMDWCPLSMLVHGTSQKHTIERMRIQIEYWFVQSSMHNASESAATVQIGPASQHVQKTSGQFQLNLNVLGLQARRRNVVVVIQKTKIESMLRTMLW